ncbi:MAG: hypothetical protein LC126_20255 [Bryobacterales bacterium]|nr:hypothetical protein [Bryobacterales bacterium]
MNSGSLTRILALAAAAAVLVSCSRPGAKTASAVSAPAERPAWVKQGIVMVGSWEPPSFQVRRGGQEVNAAELWKAERTEHSVRKLKELGVTLVITSLHKAAGLKAEAGEIEANRKFVELAHRYGIKVGGYVGSTMAYETFFAEEPDAHNWIQTDEFGRPIYYNSDQTFRYVACRNNPGYRAFVEKVLRLGVQDLKLDLIHFDQMSWWPEPGSCRCRYCQAEFHEFLRTRYSGKQRMARYGFTLLDYMAPPPYNSRTGILQLTDLHNPLMQDWALFRAANLAKRFAEYDNYIRAMRPDVAVEGNPNINLGSNLGFRLGVDYPRLLRTADIFWSEEPNHAAWAPDGRIITKIRSFKVARAMDRSVFLYTGGRYGAQTAASPPELRIAEAMAYNDANLGMVGDLSADGTELTPAAARYVKFFHEHLKDLAGSRGVPNVAILRAFPSIEFNPARSNVSTMLFEQTLIQSRIPFDIVFEPHLADLARYKVLVLANQDALSDRAVAQIRAYVQAGGGLVATEDSSLLTDWRLRRPKFGLADVFGVDSPAKPGVPTTAVLAGAPETKHESAAAERLVQHTFGKGRSVYIPRIEPSTPPPPAQINYSFGNQYWTLPRNAKDMVSALDWASDGKLVADIQAPASVAVELEEQRGSKTWLLHLINFDFQHPARDIAVRLRLPAGARVREAVVSSPDLETRDTLKPAMQGDTVSFRIPRLAIYNLVRIQLTSD